MVSRARAKRSFELGNAQRGSTAIRHFAYLNLACLHGTAESTTEAQRHREKAEKTGNKYKNLGVRQFARLAKKLPISSLGEQDPSASRLIIPAAVGWVTVKAKGFAIGVERGWGWLGRVGSRVDCLAKAIVGILATTLALNQWMGKRSHEVRTRSAGETQYVQVD